jgi:hypothetical protein
MTTPGWDEDEQLLAELRTAVQRAGAPTPRMIAASEAAYAWRTIDAELAALTHDSRDGETALVRSTSGSARTLLFEATDVSVELEETEGALVGQLVPPTHGEVTVLGPDGELARTSVDELGCFSVEPSPRGLIRLRCRTPSDVLITPWVRL